MAVLLCIAAILGNTVNYFLGDYFGAKVFKPENKILKLDYYLKTKEFFNKHGGKAVIFSRYMPIIRTIAPFVAGVGKMPFGTYMFYNIVGGLSWIIIFVFFGFLFGNIPLIKNNFSIVVLVITILSVAPMIYAALLPKFKRAKVKA